MVRVKNGAHRHQRHKKWLKLAKGYVGGRSKLYRTARVAVLRAGKYAYRDRRVRKREMRSLWITRLSAAVRMRGLRYGQFIHGLKLAKIEIDRKQLSELAIHDAAGFDAVIEKVKSTIGA
jgi:large subunit ribosomal protein L20